MSLCCICRLTVLRSGLNIFEARIGKPSILISDLVLNCIHGTNLELAKDGKICRKCSVKLHKFYKAKLVVKQIKREVLQLMQMHSVDTTDVVEDCISDELIDDALVKLEDTSETLDDKSQCADYLGNDNDDNYYQEEESDEYSMEEPLKVEFIGLKCDSSEIMDLPIDNEHKEAVMDDVSLMNTVLQNSPTMSDDDDDDDFFQDITNVESDFEVDTAAHDDFEEPQSPKSKKMSKSKKSNIKRSSARPVLNCPHCEKTFRNNRSYAGHIKNEHYFGYVCELCGKFFKFRTDSHVNRHLASHTGYKPFSCPICGKCFSQNYNLKVHIKEHEEPGSTRKRRFKCKKCSSTFTNAQNFKDHCQRNDCVA